MYQPQADFSGLFHAFTGGPDAIGPQLTALMLEQQSDNPLLVSTASDIALFPGRGAAPRMESFRKSTRGFIELTAVSHLPLAIAYVARRRELAPDDLAWRTQLQGLLPHIARVREANTVGMWRQHVNLDAFAGQEAKIVAMVNYTLSTTERTIERALADASAMDLDALVAQYFDPPAAVLPVPMNAIMFATFGLAYVDIAYRIGRWLRGSGIDWARAMVLVSGQSGRPTAGVTWSSNSMCNLVWRVSDGQMPADRLYVAPHAPGFSVDQFQDTAALAGLEQTYRRLWMHTRTSVEVSRSMFANHPAYVFSPATAQDMPPIHGLDDQAACVARLRRIMEDPQQLLVNCVADYVVDTLQRNGNLPGEVPIPGFTNVDYEGLS
jgi:hypothetical protein